MTYEILQEPTWGDSDSGGDSSCVGERLSGGVQKVVGNYYAFAAVKADGSVVTWGDPRGSGDSSQVAVQLSSGVRTVVGNALAYVFSNSELERIFVTLTFFCTRNLFLILFYD